MKAKKRPFKHYRLTVNDRVVAYYNTGQYSFTMAQSHAKKGRTVAIQYRMTHVNVGQWYTIWKP